MGPSQGNWKTEGENERSLLILQTMGVQSASKLSSSERKIKDV